jgi:nitrogen-specific signal transduction histidine kinase
MQVGTLRDFLFGSLRRQFLVPLVSLLLLISLTVTFSAQQFAVRSARIATESRLRDLLELCKLERFPLTESVLGQIGAFADCKLQIVSEVEVTDKLFDVLGEDSIRYDGFAIELPPSQSAFEPTSSRRFLLALTSPRDRLERAAQAFWLPMETGILSTLAVGIAALWIANRMVRRLELLEHQVQRIAQGDYSQSSNQPNSDQEGVSQKVDNQQLTTQNVPNDVSSKDSIASLTRTINAMSQQLEKAQGEIAKAERARLINVLASGMAHQLRNSLAGALLLLQTMLKRLTNPPDEIPFAIQQIQLAEESIRRLLTISRPGRHVEDQPMSIAEIHRQLECYIQSIVSHHQLQWLIRCDSDDPTIELGRIVSAGSSVVSSLLNLAMNAIEAHLETAQGAETGTTAISGIVECVYRFDPSDEMHHWILRDNGPGPDPAIANQMFDPFVTGKREGVGLGLPTASMLAKQLGGDLQWRRKDGWTEFEWTISARTMGKISPPQE